MRETTRSGRAGRKLSTELAEATPTSRLVAYLTAAIAVTVVAALVALAMALRAGIDGPRHRAPAPGARVQAAESEIDVSDPAAALASSAAPLPSAAPVHHPAGAERQTESRDAGAPMVSTPAGRP